MWDLIVLIVIGGIMGALARLFMRGDQNIGILWTIILGALGALIGGWISTQLFSGSDIAQWIVGIILAAVFIGIYIAVRGRSTTTRR